LEQVEAVNDTELVNSIMERIRKDLLPEISASVHKNLLEASPMLVDKITPPLVERITPLLVERIAPMLIGKVAPTLVEGTSSASDLKLVLRKLNSLASSIERMKKEVDFGQNRNAFLKRKKSSASRMTTGMGGKRVRRTRVSKRVSQTSRAQITA